MKFQNKRLGCDLQASSGPPKSEKTFQSGRRRCYAAMNQLFKGQRGGAEWFHAKTQRGIFHRHGIGFQLFFFFFPSFDLCLIESEGIALDWKTTKAGIALRCDGNI